MHVRRPRASARWPPPCGPGPSKTDLRRRPGSSREGLVDHVLRGRTAPHDHCRGADRRLDVGQDRAARESKRRLRDDLQERLDDRGRVALGIDRLLHPTASPAADEAADAHLLRSRRKSSNHREQVVPERESVSAGASAADTCRESTSLPQSADLGGGDHDGAVDQLVLASARPRPQHVQAHPAHHGRSASRRGCRSRRCGAASARSPAPLDEPRARPVHAIGHGSSRVRRLELRRHSCSSLTVTSLPLGPSPG